MATKKHPEHPHLTGEHRWGDTVQLILLFLFLIVWIGDSFFLRLTTMLSQEVALYIRLPLAALVLLLSLYLARAGMKAVFGTPREKPVLISEGVFRWVRHPIYTGALLLYLGVIISTLSLAALAFWIIILIFYMRIARYEERILEEAFGKDYSKYKSRTGMLIPRPGSGTK